MEKVRIKQATKKGYIECAVGGGRRFIHPVKLEGVVFKKMVGFAQPLQLRKQEFAE